MAWEPSVEPLSAISTSPATPVRARKPRALRDAGLDRLRLVQAGHEDGQLHSRLTGAPRFRDGTQCRMPGQAASCRLRHALLIRGSRLRHALLIRGSGRVAPLGPRIRGRCDLLCSRSAPGFMTQGKSSSPKRSCRLGSARDRRRAIRLGPLAHPRPRARIRGLDGLRAVAVVAVILYHAGINWFPAVCSASTCSLSSPASSSRHCWWRSAAGPDGSNSARSGCGGCAGWPGAHRAAAFRQRDLGAAS